jgi:hypothetical protein
LGNETIDPLSPFSLAAASFIYQQVTGRAKVTNSNFELVEKKIVDLGIIPTCICNDKRGIFYICSYYTMYVYSQDWVQLRNFDIDGGAYTCATDDDNNLYVSSTEDNQMLKYDVDGNLVTTYGTGYGLDLGQLYYPRGIVADRKGKGKLLS